MTRVDIADVLEDILVGAGNDRANEALTEAIQIMRGAAVSTNPTTIAREAIRLGTEAANSWACVARSKRDEDYIYGLHQKLKALTAELDAATITLGQSAGDVYLAAVDAWMDHGPWCESDGCRQCDILVNHMRAAQKVWKVSQHRAISVQSEPAAPEQAPCSHKFVDTNHCVKCGWIGNRNCLSLSEIEARLTQTVYVRAEAARLRPFEMHAPDHLHAAAQHRAWLDVILAALRDDRCPACGQSVETP